ncbi:MAG: GNAT family N-acetyltransferase [Candidatus Sericytochromatia bacterium]
MSLVFEWGVTPAQWEAYLARCPRATFFHTHAWYAANAAASGYRLNTAFARFSDHDEALLPLAVSPRFRGLVQTAVAGIETGYGGLVSPGPLSEERVAAVYQRVRAVYPNLRVTGNPFEAYPNVPPDGVRETDSTQVLPLLDPAEQRKRMSDTRLKHCKRAAKAGFRLEVVEGLTADDVPRFYPLYARHAADWSYTRWIRDEAFFVALTTHAGRLLVLLLAYQGDQLAGMRILGLTGPVVMDLFLATDPAFEPQYVGPLLAEAALNWAHASGYARFDFQPSGRLEGVHRYKAAFGAEEVANVITVHSSLLGRSLESVWQLTKGREAS